MSHKATHHYLTHKVSDYIYIYIERERERERLAYLKAQRKNYD